MSIEKEKQTIQKEKTRRKILQNKGSISEMWDNIKLPNISVERRDGQKNV